MMNNRSVNNESIAMLVVSPSCSQEFQRLGEAQAVGLNSSVCEWVEVCG